MELNAEEEKFIKIIEEIGMETTVLDIWLHGKYEQSQDAINNIEKICISMVKKGILQETMPGCFKISCDFAKSYKNK